MARALALRLNQPALNAAFAALNADLVARGAGGKQGALRIANALWGERTYPFNPAYSAEIKRSYGAGLQPVDFASAPEAVRGEINAWVARRTGNRIQNIVPPGAITAATRLVLANAMYFYGPWLSQFQPSDTEKDAFHLLGGSAATVRFMVQQQQFGYARGHGFQAVELPYAQQGFALTILIPDEGRFDAFEAKLDATTLDAALGQIAATEIVLYLPKFTFDFGASLASVLASLGMTDAFDSKRANFSGMISGKPPGPLWLGEVLHKAFISVDEAGTEAAAATVVTAPGAAAPGPRPTPPVVRIDRPFVFAIRDTTTGTLLFLGRVLDPRG
jgi:serpin B